MPRVYGGRAMRRAARARDIALAKGELQAKWKKDEDVVAERIGVAVLGMFELAKTRAILCATRVSVQYAVGDAGTMIARFPFRCSVAFRPVRGFTKILTPDGFHWVDRLPTSLFSRAWNWAIDDYKTQHYHDLWFSPVRAAANEWALYADRDRPLQFDPWWNPED